MIAFAEFVDANRLEQSHGNQRPRTSARRDISLVSQGGGILSELGATVSFCWSMISVSSCLDHINESLLLPAQIRRHYHN